MNVTLERFFDVFSAGEMVIVFDEHRENEADFFVLSEYVTPEKINFLMEKGKGMICTACSAEVIDTLDLPLMVEENDEPHSTNFCVTVDVKEGITTGVSASDRSKTISMLANPKATRNDFSVPGHTFPLRAVEDFSERFGHTEAAVGLAQKVEKIPVVTICEILNTEGEKATFNEVSLMAEELNLPMMNLVQLKEALLD